MGVLLGEKGKPTFLFSLLLVLEHRFDIREGSELDALVKPHFDVSSWRRSGWEQIKLSRIK
jgi:hypothetical protein